MRITLNNLNQNIISLVILIGLFFPSYKYIFAYGEPNTSGPYFSQIPQWLLVIDDALIIVLLFISILLSILTNRKISLTGLLVGSIFLLTNLGIILGTDWESIKQSKEQFIFALFAFAALGFFYRDGADNIKFIKSYSLKILIFLLLFFLVQIFLLAAIGKPPVISWSTNFDDVFSPIMRFGSFISSANHAGSFAVLLLLLSNRRGLEQILLICLVFIFLLFAWSLTSYVAFIIYLFFYFYKTSRILFFLISITTLLTFLILITQEEILDLLQLLLQDKSTKKHLDLIFLKGVELSFLDFGAEGTFKNESLYSWLLVNNGILFGSILILLMIAPLLLFFQFGNLDQDIQLALMFHFIVFVLLFSVPISHYYGIGFLHLALLHYLYQRIYQSFQ